MESITIVFGNTTEDKVAEFLSKNFPKNGDGWIAYREENVPLAYIDWYPEFKSEHCAESGESTWQELSSELGYEPSVFLIADVSRQSEIYRNDIVSFVNFIVSEFNGHAQDHNSCHFWNREEIVNGYKGRCFFDSKGVTYSD